MQLMTSKRLAMSLQRCALLLLGCSLATACEDDEPLGGDETMVVGGQPDASTTTTPPDTASSNMSPDAGLDAPTSAGGGNAGGGNAGSAGGGNAGGGNAGGGNAGGGNAGGGNAGGGNAGGGASGLDAGPSDAGSTSGIVIGPSMRRDGGPARWDPDAAGPILNAEKQAACMELVQNICTRLTDCEIMLAGLTQARRNQVFESCRMSFLRTHNCNRAVATASGFAACSQATKTSDCVEVFATDFGTSCVDQITFER